VPALRKKFLRERPIYYFIPAIVVLGILAVYPLFNNVWLSFTKSDNTFTVQHYQRLLSDKRFWNSLLTSGKWLGFTVVGELLVGIILATLTNMKLKGTKFFRTVLMIPWMTPMIAICTIWAWMYNGDFGILSYVINKLFNTNILFLSDPKTTILWLSIVYIWKRSSFSMLMYLSGLQGITEDIYDSCKIDGASWFRRLFNVVLPLMFPVMRSLLLLSVITSLNQFTIAYSITAGGPARTTELIQLYIYNIGIAGFQYNYGAAASTIFLAIVIILASIYIFFTENLEEGMF
jgi:multiple sugar transport system permease protein